MLHSGWLLVDKKAWELDMYTVELHIGHIFKQTLTVSTRGIAFSSHVYVKCRQFAVRHGKTKAGVLSLSFGETKELGLNSGFPLFACLQGSYSQRSRVRSSTPMAQSRCQTGYRD